MRVIDMVDGFIVKQSKYERLEEIIISYYERTSQEITDEKEKNNFDKYFRNYFSIIEVLNKTIDETPNIKEKYPLVVEREEYQEEIIKHFGIRTEEKSIITSK